MSYQNDVDQLAQRFPQINIYNANAFFEKHKNEILLLSQKYGSDSTRILSKGKKDNLCTLVPGIASYDSETVYSLFNDIWNSNRRYHRTISFEKYNKLQPLFSLFPDLFSKVSCHGKHEYLPAKAFRYAGQREGKDENTFIAFEYKKHFLSVPYAGVELFGYILDKYESFDIHVSPYHFYRKDETDECLEHGVKKPIDPKHVHKFYLQKGHTGGHYTFDYMNPKFENHREYVQSFNVCGTSLVGSQGLEVIVNERNSDMSMMLEELVKETDNTLIGYGVHLDILEAIGRDLTQLKINHLDLAVNVYENDDISRRLANNLCNGKKVAKASYRTHILRIENIPFFDMLQIISIFMKSKCLVMDWIDDQFPDHVQY